MPRARGRPLSVWRRSAGEMSLSDFGEVFGYGGLYDKFFHRPPRQAGRQVAASVDLASRVGGTSPGMLAQFERAERIRQMFFDAGSKTPQLDFIVHALEPRRHRRRGSTSTSTVSGSTSKPDVETGIDGGLARSKEARLRGRKVRRPVAAAAEDVGIRRPGRGRLFHMIDETLVPQRGHDAVSFVLRLQTRFHRAGHEHRGVERQRAIRSPPATGGSSGANPDGRYRSRR